MVMWGCELFQHVETWAAGWSMRFHIAERLLRGHTLSSYKQRRGNGRSAVYTGCAMKVNTGALLRQGVLDLPDAMREPVRQRLTVEVADGSAAELYP
jgi:ferric-dicitrate binding protein FerR (iron transport regulator)